MARTRAESRGRWSATRVALLGVVGALVVGPGCGKPAPDPDASPAGVADLKLDAWHRDRIDCRRKASDCADWFRIRIRREGRLQIDIARVAESEGAPEVPPFSLVLARTTGRPVRTAEARGETRLRIQHAVKPGSFMVSVSTPPDSGGVMDYELRAAFTAKPPPQGPRYEQVSAVVLEVETGDEGESAVLIDVGTRQGLAVGQRGRLLEAGSKLADIEIVDVYSDGSRAVIRGELSGEITPSTVAEVDVPL